MENEKALIQSDGNGVIVGKTLDQQWRLAQYFAASKILPSHFNTPEKIFTAMQVCYEMNLHPLTAMAKMYIVNGRISFFGDMPLSLCYRSGKVDGIFYEYYTNKDGKVIDLENISDEVYASVSEAKRVGTDKTVRRFFTVDNAKQAGIWGQKVWALYPFLMLKYRSRSILIKDLFPDCLNGMAIAEYDFDQMPSMGYVEKPKRNEVEEETNELNEKYKLEESDDNNG